ncbi:MAG: hypothetical protein OXF27_09005 [Acidobacteria bacterium]|nr:hypothetical protein [Acidobacteriota bacterium]
MGRRILMAAAVLPVLIGIAWVAPATLEAQSAAARTPWGDPDLQGLWTNTTTTPMERPDDLAEKDTLSSEELAARDAEVAEAVSFDNISDGNVGAYNEFWVERGALITQTSLIVDPPDGKLPPMTEDAQRKSQQFIQRWIAPPESWEDMNLYDRCITRGLPGAMIPGFYNHNYLILQTPDHVVLQVEMIHDTRIIPLAGRQHAPSGIPEWMGHSLGRWDGDTLVVETEGFAAKAEQRVALANFFLTFSGGPNSRLVERFTRLDDGTLDYRFTVTDPTIDTREWTAAIPMQAYEEPLYEYACHEGNYAMPNILAGARADEERAAAEEQSR